MNVTRSDAVRIADRLEALHLIASGNEDEVVNAIMELVFGWHEENIWCPRCDEYVPKSECGEYGTVAHAVYHDKCGGRVE